MKRAIMMLMAGSLGCVIPIRTVLWRSREGVGEVATPMAYMNLSYQQRTDADIAMKKLCRGPFEVEEEGSRDSGDMAGSSWNSGAIAISGTARQKEYFWRFRCVDEEN